MSLSPRLVGAFIGIGSNAEITLLGYKASQDYISEPPSSTDKHVSMHPALRDDIKKGG